MTNNNDNSNADDEWELDPKKEEPKALKIAKELQKEQ